MLLRQGEAAEALEHLEYFLAEHESRDSAHARATQMAQQARAAR